MNNFRRRVEGGESGPTSLGTYGVIKQMEFISFEPYYMCDTSSPNSNTEQQPLTGTFQFEQLDDYSYLQCELRYRLYYDKVELFDDGSYNIINTTTSDCKQTYLKLFDNFQTIGCHAYSSGIDGGVQYRYSDRNSSVSFDYDSQDILYRSDEIGTSVSFNFHIEIFNYYRDNYPEFIYSEPFVKLTLTKIAEDQFQYSVESLV